MSALQSLIATRLVRLTSDGQVLVEDPRIALERLVDGEEARLEARRRALAETRGRDPPVHRGAPPRPR